MSDSADFIRVATLEELKEKEVMVVQAADRPVAVFASDGEVRAVDNRCPHLGFPLHKGTIQDGILTCHWHHARFDLCSGCTFDLFADDVPAFDAEVRDGEVFVSVRPRKPSDPEQYFRRLREGMEQNISLIQGKCIIGLMQAGVDYRDIIRQIALFGVHNRNGWAMGMTILTAMANLVPYLEEDVAYLALFQGARRVAQDCAGQTPRRDRYPLESEELSLDTLKRWLRYWTLVRHRDGAERTLLTAIQNGASQEELADLIFTAATDRYYADVGHVFDFCNKAFELLDLIGWDHAATVLPTIVGQLASARGGEEMNSWRHPIDLVPHMQAVEKELPSLLEEGAGKSWNNEAELGLKMLGEDPLAILDEMKQALRDGATPQQLAKALAYAAAMRIARFGTVNEFRDWITALHTFTYCNAIYQVTRRCSSPDVTRGIFHGAMSVYLDRFLNIPPAQLPSPEFLPSERVDAEKLKEQFLGLLDQRSEVDAAAKVTAAYLRDNDDMGPLFNTLTEATVREDADFHTFQMLEAGIQQYNVWTGEPEAEHILLAIARFLAAHSPTQRAQLQTANIALRLHRGEDLYEEE